MKNYIDAARLAILSAQFPSVTFDADATRPALYVAADDLLALLTFLRDDARFSYQRLENLTSADYKTYFEMVYHLYSWSERNDWVTVKVKIEEHENPVAPSVTPVFPGAEYEEREVYDLMGISFTGHPDLRRVLLADDFSGHPLRKDYKQIATPHVPRLRREGGRIRATD